MEHRGGASQPRAALSLGSFFRLALLLMALVLFALALHSPDAGAQTVLTPPA